MVNDHHNFFFVYLLLEGKKDINIWEDPSIQLTGDDDNQNINENELLSKSTLNQLVARLTPRATVPGIFIYIIIIILLFYKILWILEHF